MTISIKNLSLQYQEHVLFNNINFAFKENSITVIKGENGCGKTTLLKSIMTLNKDFSGSINCFGKDNKKLSLPTIAKDIYFCMQNPDRQILCDSVHQEVQFACMYRDIDTMHIDSILKQLDLYQYLDQYPLSLSSGQKQRLQIACALAVKPRVLLLDEPTACLDIDSINKLITILHNLTCTIIITSHDQEFIKLLNAHVYCLKGGKLYETT